MFDRMVSLLWGIVSAPLTAVKAPFSKLYVQKCTVSYYPEKVPVGRWTAPASLEINSEGFSCKEMANPHLPLTEGDLPKCVMHILGANNDHIGFASWVHDPNVAHLPGAKYGVIYTALHAVEVAASTDGKIRLYANGVSFTLDPKPVRIIRAFDQCMLSAPKDLGSYMGLSKGKLKRITASRQVTLYAAPAAGDGRYRKCTSVATLAKTAFRVNYPASTLPGSSGTPIMQGNFVTGVHTTGTSTRGQVINCGSLWFDVPCTSHRKESPNRSDDNYVVHDDEIRNPEGRFRDEVYTEAEMLAQEYEMRQRHIAAALEFRMAMFNGRYNWAEDSDYDEGPEDVYEEDVIQGPDGVYAQKKSRREAAYSLKERYTLPVSMQRASAVSLRKLESNGLDFQSEQVDPPVLASHKGSSNRTALWLTQQQRRLVEAVASANTTRPDTVQKEASYEIERPLKTLSQAQILQTPALVVGDRVEIRAAVERLEADSIAQVKLDIQEPVAQAQVTNVKREPAATVVAPSAAERQPVPEGTSSKKKSKKSVRVPVVENLLSYQESASMQAENVGVLMANLYQHLIPEEIELLALSTGLPHLLLRHHLISKYYVTPVYLEDMRKSLKFQPDLLLSKRDLAPLPMSIGVESLESGKKELEMKTALCEKLDLSQSSDVIGKGKLAQRSKKAKKFAKSSTTGISQIGAPEPSESLSSPKPQHL